MQNVALFALVSFTFHIFVAIHFLREVNPLKPYIEIKNYMKFIQLLLCIIMCITTNYVTIQLVLSTHINIHQLI